MKLFIERKYRKTRYIIGRMYINGTYVADTLEPPEMKAGGCIPAGTYRVRMQYSMKFGKSMPRIENVPYRSGILIHAGNTPDDTKGCILVGHNTQPGKVMLSQRTLNPIIRKIMKSEMQGEPVVITIR
jgi:hypothetical protein